MSRTKVLIIMSSYLPGFRAGGPIQSIKNLIFNLSDKIDFKILTIDRDFGSIEPYKNIEYNFWNKIEKALVKYCKPKEFNSINFLKNFLNKEDYEIIYLNSSFASSTIKILFLRKFKLIPNKKIIIAPRGEYSSGALKLKALKKKIFLKISNILGLYSSVIWQATTKEEAKLIKKIHKKYLDIVTAGNLKEIKKIKKSIIKKPQELKLIFASRISPKKNLKMCIEILKKFDLNGIEFDIVGPIEDEKYWQECQRKIKKLRNVKVRYLGIQSNENLLETLSQYHFFFFPTLGENFGHIILESLIAKTPVILSDQTPWKNLEEKGIGWDISILSDVDYLKKLKYCYELNNNDYTKLVDNISQFINSYKQDLTIQKNENLFLKEVRICIK